MPESSYPIKTGREMKISTDDLGNGASTEERFAGLQYRNARRDGANDPLGGDLPAPQSRNGKRSGGPLSAVSALEAPVSALEPLSGPAVGDLDSLSEPIFSAPAVWGDEPPHPMMAWDSSPLADHPLLRGLLLELPPKGSNPPADWLDRWFEAARSILELLYQQGSAAAANTGRR